MKKSEMLKLQALKTYCEQGGVLTKSDLFSRISYSTAKHLKWHDELNYIPVSIQDLVDLLNGCAGDDCYYCSWEYTVIDGKPYEVDKHIVIDDWGI